MTVTSSRRKDAGSSRAGTSDALSRWARNSSLSSAGICMGWSFFRLAIQAYAASSASGATVSGVNRKGPGSGSSDAPNSMLS